MSSLTVAELYQYGEQLAKNNVPLSIHDLYKVGEDLANNSYDIVSEESPDVYSIQNKNNEKRAANVTVHCNKANEAATRSTFKKTKQRFCNLFK